jgi:hypothetical protein
VRTPTLRVRSAPTVRDPGRPGLVLEFEAGVIDVPAGGSVLLGRDPGLCPMAALLERYGNLSRRHATVGVGDDGLAWIRDEDSTNGTFLDGRRLTPLRRVPLRADAALRLAADVPVRVRTAARPASGVG